MKAVWLLWVGIFALGSAQAASVAVELTEARWGGGQEYAPLWVSGTVTGIYDTGTNTVTMDSGTLTVTHPLGASIVWWQHMDDAAWNLNAGAAAFSAWECVDGPFAISTLSASVCGGIGPGNNGTLESTVDYSAMPGTRSVIGDDVVVADQFQGADYDALLVRWGSGELIINSLTWSDTGTVGDNNPDGYQLVFTETVPVPAAVWLFGSALGVLGRLRRRTG